jgi:hypothetical protein
MTKEELHYMAEASGFIPSRFGRAFGYEASLSAIERLVERIEKKFAKEHQVDAIIEPETNKG